MRGGQRASDAVVRPQRRGRHDSAAPGGSLRQRAGTAAAACVAPGAGKAVSQRNIAGSSRQTCAGTELLSSSSATMVCCSGRAFCCSRMTIRSSGTTFSHSGKMIRCSRKAFCCSGMTIRYSGKAFCCSGMTICCSGKPFCYSRITIRCSGKPFCYSGIPNCSSAAALLFPKRLARQEVPHDAHTCPAARFAACLDALAVDPVSGPLHRPADAGLFAQNPQNPAKSSRPGSALQRRISLGGSNRRV